MKNILITGASGFIGQQLAEAVAAKGYKAIASVRKSSDIRWLKKHNIPCMVMEPGMKDTLYPKLKEVSEIHGSISCIVHNAGITQAYSQQTYEDINYGFTKDLIDAFITLGSPYPQFIFISSIAALGPGPADGKSSISEEQSPQPVSDYGKSKLKAESCFHNDLPFNWTVVRPAVVYGPRERNLFKLIRTLNQGLELYPAGKKQLLSLIHVEDLVEAYMVLMDSEPQNKTYNLSDGKVYEAVFLNRVIKELLNKKTLSIQLPYAMLKTIAAVATVVGRIMQKPSIINNDKLKEMKQPNWSCDASSIQKDTGFKPKITLTEGMTQTIKWYKDNDWI